MPMAARSLMPGMLQSKTTASDQLKAACEEDGASSWKLSQMLFLAQVHSLLSREEVPLFWRATGE